MPDLRGDEPPTAAFLSGYWFLACPHGPSDAPPVSKVFFSQPSSSGSTMRFPGNARECLEDLDRALRASRVRRPSGA
jgi:hypothetical protein